MVPVWKFYPGGTGSQPCEVSPERWAWVALYSDGTFLEQYGQDGIFHQFREIDQSRLIAFQMVNLLGLRAPLIMHWKPERKLIHFYRTIRLQVGTPQEIEVRLYCFGYEVNGSKVILAIMPDDQIRIVEDVSEIAVV